MQRKAKPTLKYKIPINWMFDMNLRVKSEFKLYNLMPGNGFRCRLLRRCHGKEISGYIVFTHGASRAFGVMIGQRKHISEMKDWLLSSCIPEPFTKRIKFSSFKINFNPNRESFHVKYTLPKNAKFLGDMDDNYFRDKKCMGKPKKRRCKELGEYADFYSPEFFAKSKPQPENFDNASTTVNTDAT
ncbi:uncharacterized protein LOC119546007 [Drosophila subpulchrella]|uniref:uncharacterized protein LOC119546007 n=1 Tax=Drosophila subpulchrella TaxID=1486046 RepID=UPI0018A17B5F|nr:uncharacterized protein LOC119546007 [Drosophila subpulchrella]